MHLQNISTGTIIRIILTDIWNSLCIQIYGNFHTKTVHEGLREHKCSYCEKYFKRPSHLKVHIETINEHIKKYECNHCNKSFAQLSNFKRHIEKPCVKE